MQMLVFSAVTVAVLVSLQGAHAAREGDPCPLQKGVTGVCVPYSACRRVLEETGSRIRICTQNAREGVVCCPRDYQAQMQQLLAQDSRLSVSARMCKEFSRLATPSLYLSSLKPDGEVIRSKSKSCSTDNNLIVGGDPAKPMEFPHMAAIGYREPNSATIDYRCGGSLISDRYVLSVSHCSEPTAVTVRLGDIDLKSDEDGAFPQEYDIDEFIKHPEHKVRTKHHDIALIRLKQTVRFTSHVRPACLYQSERVQEQRLTATGYGAKENFGENANKLLKVVLEQFDQSICAPHYPPLVDSQMCVGHAAGGRDTCQGDSGGPLQVRGVDNDCVFYIVGVTSYGSFCGTTVPSIYTKVASYLPWIERIVWGSS